MVGHEAVLVKEANRRRDVDEEIEATVFDFVAASWNTKSAGWSCNVLIISVPSQNFRSSGEHK